MATSPIGAYSDEPTEEELRIAAELDSDPNAPLPPPEDADGLPVPPAPEAPAPATDAPAADAPAADAPAPPVVQTEDEKFAAWKAQHAGKTPEEIERLAFQQSQRAAGAAFQQRRAAESLEAIQTRAREALERAATRKAQLAETRTAFDQQLQDDPDAATRAVHERMMSAEERAIERAEHEAKLDSAIALASTAIPNFQQTAPETYAFGAEMNYSPEELSNISDGRDLVVLHLASLTGKLIKSGVMDIHGNFKKMPGAVAQTDPRLTAPAPVTTLSSAPARNVGGGATVDSQLLDLTKMSDADFDKLDPAVLEGLLRKAG
jgi:hypothetical protein